MARRRWLQSIAAVCSLVLLFTAGVVKEAASAGSAFVGDYETGDFGQWPTCQDVRNGSRPCDSFESSYSMQIEENLVRQGRFAARFEVRQGDHPEGMCCGDRAEVAGVGAVDADEGDAQWYQWSSLFGEGFPDAEGSWFSIAQWHARRDGVPPVALDSYGDGRLGLSVQTWDEPGKLGALFEPWYAPLRTGVWIDVKFHIKWSTSADVGFIELWVDGAQQTFTGAPCEGQTRCGVKTLMPGGGGVYYKQGYYRKNSTVPTGVVYHDGFSTAGVESELEPL